MTKIAVVGAGQGGMVAAIKLANAGYAVDVFEKAPRETVGYPWRDDIRFDIFELSAIEAPKQSEYCQKNKWLFVSPDGKTELPFPPAKPMEEVSVSRRGLCAHLAALAENAGAKLHYQTEVSALATEGNRVTGIIVDGKKCDYDLTIDASGLFSPFRAQVPAVFGVQATPSKNDIMYGYRAFFKRKKGSATPAIASTLHVKHLDGVGISWCNLDSDNAVDVLVARIGELTDNEIASDVAALRREHDILSDELICERRVPIGVRYTLARFVADGYVAIGDSAFMSMPLMGSGIEASMKAGRMFADLVVDKKMTAFDAAAMWDFEVKYMRELGADFALIDIVKRWALNLPPSVINHLFGCGLVEASDLALISTDSNAKVKIPAKTILKKVGIVFKNFGIIFKAVGRVLCGLKAKRIAANIPSEFDLKKVERWQKKYDGVIDKAEKKNK